jgi:hypothetical protein
LQKFREENKVPDDAPQRIFINRFEDDLENDLLGMYKNPAFRLQAEPRVRFEAEPGVGIGPVREFFCLSLQLLESGLSNIGQGRVIIFEGSTDHKLPVVNNLMKQAGLYLTVGKMLAHSILHGGPPYYGLSPAVIHYWKVDDMERDPLPLSLDDIPDYELRTVLQEVLGSFLYSRLKDYYWCSIFFMTTSYFP